MIPLPQGVTLNKEATIQVRNITTDMMTWCEEQGGIVSNKEFVTARGKTIQVPCIQFVGSRPSYHTQDGLNNYLIRFRGDDAGTALMFLLKFNELVVSHNMKEIEHYAY